MAAETLPAALNSILCLAGLLNSTTELLQWLLEKQPMGFLPTSATLWQFLASLMHMYEASTAADAAATPSSPLAAGLRLILCELAPLNQQFLAVLTTHRHPHWPAHYKRNVSVAINMLLLWQEAALRIAVKVIEGQQKTAQEAAAGDGGGGGGRGGAAGGDGDTFGAADMEQLAASPALLAAAWAQLAAFCQGMYTWQYGKLAKAQHSSSSKCTSSRSSSVAGSSDLAGMFASLQLFPDHEQVAAVFDPGEISARIEALRIPAKGRPSSEAALGSTVRSGFLCPAAFLIGVLRTSYGWSIFCEGLSPQQRASGIKGCGSRPVGSCSSGGGSSSGRGDSRGVGNRAGGGSSSGRGDSSGEGNRAGKSSNSGRGDSSGGGNSGSNSNGGSGSGGSSNTIAGAGKSISMSSTWSSSGEGSSCSSGRIWSSSRGGVAPAAALQLLLEAAALLGVADMPEESSHAVAVLSAVATRCSLGPLKCLLSTRGGLLLDALAAATRYDPASISGTAACVIRMFLDGAGEGGWGLDGTSDLPQPRSNVCAFSVLHGWLFFVGRLAADVT